MEMTGEGKGLGDCMDGLDLGPFRGPNYFPGPNPHKLKQEGRAHPFGWKLQTVAAIRSLRGLSLRGFRLSLPGMLAEGRDMQSDS